MMSGFNARVLNAKNLPVRAACLNFVQDQQNAVFLSHFTDALQPPTEPGFTPSPWNGFPITAVGLRTPLQPSLIRFSKRRSALSPLHRRYPVATVLVWVRHELHFWYHTVYRFFRERLLVTDSDTVESYRGNHPRSDDTATAGDFSPASARCFHGVSTDGLGELQAVLLP